MKNIKIGTTFLNTDNAAGTYVTRPSGRKVYIFKTCKVLSHAGFLQGTNIEVFNAITDKNEKILLDEEDVILGKLIPDDKHNYIFNRD